MSPTRIAELAAKIQEHTSKVDEYLASKALPSPSFDITTPATFNLPPSIQASQNAVLEASDELNLLMLGPLRSIASLPFNPWVSVQAIQRFGIATSFAPGEISTFSDIARTCSLPESDVCRILRHAMTYRIFREPRKGLVEHTAASKALAERPLLCNLVGFLSGEIWPSATRLVDAMEKWPGSQKPNETGFSLAYNTDVPMFDVVGRDKERAKHMAGAMTLMHAGPGYSVKHLLEGFEWGAAAQGQVVDVGGGVGTVGAEIARFFPRVKCTVQDLPEVLDEATIPEDLRDGHRLDFMPHDFFEPQTVEGADLYLLRWVLHDWSDEYATKILRNLIPALKRGAVILVCDLCLSPPGVLSPYAERSARSFDLAMKGIQNAKERDADDWARVFRDCDAGFEFQGIQKPPESTLSFISATWKG
ncbi:MAG: hypothetical protein Q9160_004911 [Pyrenula sp. 1 TL-2023]